LGYAQITHITVRSAAAVADKWTTGRSQTSNSDLKTHYILQSIDNLTAK